jgi:nucleoside 2-deoxyribosyltransferase
VGIESFTISASLKHIDLIRRLIEQAKEQGLIAIFPNIDSGIKKEDVTPELMAKLEADHFRSIENTDALYVICPEGKVGSMVSVEIGYAVAKRKLVIFSEVTNDLGLDTLSTGVVPPGEIGRIKLLS